MNAKINNVIKNNYPIDIQPLEELSDIYKLKLSHFWLWNITENSYFPFTFDINGNVLSGGNEKWMKNIVKILKNKKTLEWNCWEEYKKDSINHEVYKHIAINYNENKYKDKYKGKIHLHVSTNSRSSAWFFITYLIYAFVKFENIHRYTKTFYGCKIKFGKILKNDNLVINGTSGTTSGDGNTITVNYKNIDIICPTEQFIYSSVKSTDWNRFWL